jgi:hypothetical protein
LLHIFSVLRELENFSVLGHQYENLFKAIGLITVSTTFPSIWIPEIDLFGTISVEYNRNMN